MDTTDCLGWLSMDSDEYEIYFYLKRWHNEYHSALEICRLAGGRKRFLHEPEWAKPALARLLQQGLVEVDATGHYRLKPTPETQPPAVPPTMQRWISPQIQDILLSSGKEFSELLGPRDNQPPRQDRP
jgi:hypothetical protein